MDDGLSGMQAVSGDGCTTTRRVVIPAKAGFSTAEWLVIQRLEHTVPKSLDPRFRGDDGLMANGFTGVTG